MRSGRPIPSRRALKDNEFVIDNAHIQELLRTKADGRLFHREGQELEFKEQFNLAGLAEYFRDFAAFANNRGGYMVFGVTENRGQVL